LLHCCGDPSDTFTIWKAQYLDQDIGELDAEYFIGAGISDTLAYLSHSSNPSSLEIAHHIRTWASFIETPDSVANWQQHRRD
jgi:hypothetical protein